MKNDSDDVESPKKFSKFSCRNELDDSPLNFSVGIRKSLMSANELHKVAMFHNMKEKILTGIEVEIPDEDSPVHFSIRKYDSFEAKAKHL